MKKLIQITFVLLTTLCATEIYAQDQLPYTVLVQGVKNVDDYDKLNVQVITSNSEIAEPEVSNGVPNSSGVVNFIIRAVAPGSCTFYITVLGNNYAPVTIAISVTVVLNDDGSFGITVTPAGSITINLTPLSRALNNLESTNSTYSISSNNYFLKKE